MTKAKQPARERHQYADDGIIPNNQRLRVLVYRGVMTPEDASLEFPKLFEANGWTNCWRNGLYDCHHFHSTAHEVLGIARGWTKAKIGGAEGDVVTLRAGDVIVLPAGTGHKCESASEDLLIVGAYAEGRDYDIRRGATQERREVLANIEAVPDPERDPVTGARGTF